MLINLITFLFIDCKKRILSEVLRERMDKTIVFQSAMMYPGYSLFIHTFYIVFWIHRDLAERSTSF